NSSTAAKAGIQYAALGTTSAGTQVLATPSNTRVTRIFNGQLYGTSGSTPYTCVFTVGTGVPTSTRQIATALPGFTTSGASPYEFAVSPDGKTIYVADDRAIASGGGVQKWTYASATWSLASTFIAGLTTGVRGLSVDWSGAQPRVYVTTAAA